MVIVALGHIFVLGKVVDPDHLPAKTKQLLDEIPSDESFCPVTNILI